MTDYLVKRVGENKIVAKFNDPVMLATLLAYSYDDLEVTYNRKPIFTHKETDTHNDPKWVDSLHMSNVIGYMVSVINRYDRLDRGSITDLMCICKLAEWIDNKSGAGYYQH